MFTGIITDVGRVRQIENGKETRFAIETRYATETIAMGASIACSGVCLTVVDKGPGWFAADVSGETLSCTKMASLAVGASLNLERALKAGVSQVVFDRGPYIFHGRVKALAEAAREGGLTF